MAKEAVVGKQVTCANCGWSWSTNDSSPSDKYICHTCGKDNENATLKNGGWLNKFEDAPLAQNGIEGTMGGLTDKGFNYNGAWGGTMAMGGSLPGSVGFTYARTQSPAPSNGPYAKKTKASAQNGQEMKYYQEGLDWKPKNISRDGGWLSKYEEGGIIEDDMGQWAHPGEITKINSNQITMQGVNYPVLGISDTGDTKMMQPGKDYKFKGKSVTELPMMQQGGEVIKVKQPDGSFKTYNTNSEEYRKLYDSNRIQNYDKKTDTYFAKPLDEVVITGKAPEKGFFDQSISAFLNENKDAGLLGALSSVVTYPLGLPQQAMMYGLTGKVQRPSEALNIKNPIGALATDIIADPTNLLGIGLYDDALRLSGRASKFLTEETALKNAYKINPWAFKPNESNWYRQIGEEAIDDALNTGLIREAREEVSPRMWREFQDQIKRLQGNDALSYEEKYKQQILSSRRPTSPFFAKGELFYPMGRKPTITKSGKISKNATGKGNADYLIETGLPNEFFQPAYGKGISAGVPTEIGQTAILKPNPSLRDIENFKLYKQDWLRGYKELPKREDGGIIEYPMAQDGITRGGYGDPDYVTGTSRRAFNKMVGMGNYLVPANTLNRAADLAKAKGLDYGAITSGPADAVRHAAAAASVASRLPVPQFIGQYSPAIDRAIRIAGANLLGIGNEIMSPNSEGLLMDIKNNYQGSLIGSIPGLNDKTRNKMIINQLQKGKLTVDNPNKPKKENGGWLNKYK